MKQALQEGDHVSFYRFQATHKSYGTVRALVSGEHGPMVEIYSEDRSHTICLPLSHVELYARKGASK